MSKVEAVRRALLEIGDVPAPEMVAFVKKAYGVAIDPKYLPVLRATLKDRANLAGRSRAAGPGPAQQRAGERAA